MTTTKLSNRTGRTGTSLSSSPLPWYRSGGMKVNLIGMAINIYLPLYVLIHSLPSSQLRGYLALNLVVIVANYFLSNFQTTYCLVVMPTYLVSLTLLLQCSTFRSNVIFESASPLSAATLALALAILKVNICMSICLHRYAAHASFKCGPLTHTLLTLLGCLAHQGGPLWWASHHKCHHKHCDAPLDPHSPLIVGTERAFAFFEQIANIQVNEEYVPRHLRDGLFMRILDTWSWMVVSLEMGVSYCFFGNTGLFVTYTSVWICQAITLWFNVVNHPPEDHHALDGEKKMEMSHAVQSSVSLSQTANNTTEKKKKKTTSSSSKGQQIEEVIVKQCKATDGVHPYKTETAITNNNNKINNNNNNYYNTKHYLPFLFLDMLVPLFGFFVKETNHDHHHKHARLAKRSDYDVAYWGFVWPLEQLGLIWGVVV